MEPYRCLKRYPIVVVTLRQHRTFQTATKRLPLLPPLAASHNASPLQGSPGSTDPPLLI